MIFPQKASIILKEALEGTSCNIPDDNDIPNNANISDESAKDQELFLKIIELISSHKAISKITLFVDYNLKRDFIILIDSGADLNYIQEGLIPSRYFVKTTHNLHNASGRKMDIKYKIPKAYVCSYNVYMPESVVLVKNISNEVILGMPFFCHIYPTIYWYHTDFTSTFEVGKVRINFLS